MTSEEGKSVCMMDSCGEKETKDESVTVKEEAAKGEWNQRTKYLLGERGVNALQEASVAIVGVGGVGAYAAEMVARAGFGSIFLVDGDVLSMTNLNRHLLGSVADVGTPKVALMARRIASFNPACNVVTRYEYIRENTPRDFFPEKLDVLIDACDIASVKAHLAIMCLENNIPEVVAGGAARRLDPTKVHLSRLSETEGDPLSALLRKWIRKSCGDEALDKITVVVSDEPPMEIPSACKDVKGRAILPSFCTTPAAAGCAAAHFAIQTVLSAAGVVKSTLPVVKSKSAKAKAKKKRMAQKRPHDGAAQPQPKQKAPEEKEP